MLFTASSATTTVSLTGSAGFQYIGLDNVVVEAAGGDNPVPEPGSFLLVVGALLFVVSARCSPRS
jgi:hypothetical protein